MKSQMLELLRQYHANTDPETIKKQWQEIEQIVFDAPNAFEYVQFLCNYYSLERGECNEELISVPENMTPKFLGSFFCCNIA